MEQLLKQMLQDAKTEVTKLRNLKNLAVKNQQFELAAQVREIEKELFPETEETKAFKKRAEDLNLIFRMADLNVDNKVCWLLDALIAEFKKKKGRFSIEDAIRIKQQAKEIFPE